MDRVAKTQLYLMTLLYVLHQMRTWEQIIGNMTRSHHISMLMTLFIILVDANESAKIMSPKIPTLKFVKRLQMISNLRTKMS